ncbi:MAG: peptidoglycan-binding protein [Bacillota bacterium]|nr:peptidoglycan-binding protein [Bacillota bacterium]
MAFITYKQADSRWGRKNYNGSSDMAAAGCGPTACAMIAYGADGKTTPNDTMKYMQKHGYAIRNNGTAWNGIPSCLKSFGVKDVKEVVKMADVFALCAKGYVGVFLFRKGSRGGITWTSSGHYIAVTDYKVKNGKHYFYTRDSGGRNHTGWYCYETQMAGLIPKIWLGKVEEKNPFRKPAGKYSGVIPNPTLKAGMNSNGVKNWQLFLNWYCQGRYKLKVDGKFGNATKSATMFFQSKEGIIADGVMGKNTFKKALAYKYAAPTPENNGDLPVFPVTVPTNRAKELGDTARKLAWALYTPEKTYKFKGGNPTSACKKAMNERGYSSRTALSDCGYFQNSIIYATLGIKTKVLGSVKGSFPSVSGFRITHKGKIPNGLLKDGDIVRYKKKSGQHTLMYIGGGVIAEAGRKTRFGRSIKSAKYNADNVKHSTIEVLRVVEGTREKSFLSKGDTGSEVVKLQNFLNRVGCDCGAADGKFGIKTESAVKMFQKRNGLTEDGIFGAATLAKAKETGDKT